MSKLFDPIDIGPLRLPNRIIVAPMCQYSAVDGTPSDWHMIHLGSLGLSGAGLLILEATAVSAEGRISAKDLGLYSDVNEAAIAKIVAAIRKHSPIPIAMQANHAGRKASSRAPWEGGSQVRPDEAEGWQTEAPSAVPHSPHEAPPLELTSAGLARVKKDFVALAERAVRLGLDGLEIHMAHGYLLHQFLSPLSNKRTDEYGDSLENRMRFPLEVFDAMRAAMPKDKALWVRISATDWVDGGWDIESSVVLAKALKDRGCDAIHVSTGGVSPDQKITLGAGYQVPFAERIKKEVGITTIAVGLITEPEHAEQILRDGQADAIAIARGILYDPHWPWHAAARLGAKVVAPPQYWRSQPREYKDLFEQATHGQR